MYQEYYVLISVAQYLYMYLTETSSCQTDIQIHGVHIYFLVYLEKKKVNSSQCQTVVLTARISHVHTCVSKKH